MTKPTPRPGRDPRASLRNKRVKAEPHPKDEEPDEDELADELAYLMGQHEVTDYEE